MTEILNGQKVTRPFNLHADLVAENSTAISDGPSSSIHKSATGFAAVVD